MWPKEFDDAFVGGKINSYWTTDPVTNPGWYWVTSKREDDHFWDTCIKHLDEDNFRPGRTYYLRGVNKIQEPPSPYNND